MPSGVYVRSDETKRKIGEKSKGRKHTEETRKKMSIAKTGDKHPMYGKHCSEETNMSLIKKRGV